MTQLNAIPKYKLSELKYWLDDIASQVEVVDYIKSDPISFMHAFDHKEDQLIAGFFSAIMAWGRRDIVLSKVNDLLHRMDYAPTKYITHFDDTSARALDGFKHRTFNQSDVYWLIKIIQESIQIFGSFENFWIYCYDRSRETNTHLMDEFHATFFSIVPDTPHRTKKHIADRRKNSSCKRLYLFLRWAIRQNSPVDLGLMHFMSPAELMIPLDVHVARQARILGLTTRRQNDWKTVVDLTDTLKRLNPEDPTIYDYALFGIGVLNIQIPSKFIINTAEAVG